MSDPKLVQSAALYCPSFTNDTFKSDYSYVAPVCIALAYLFTLLFTLGAIMTEKQTRMKVGVSLWVLL